MKTIQSGDDTSGVHLWLVLWKAWTAVQAYALDDIETTALGLSDFGILELLLHKGPMQVNAIGSKMRLTSGSMTVAVDRLEKRGLVKRRNDPRDRRARVVYLTSDGQCTTKAAYEKHALAMNNLAAVLTVEQRAEAIGLLKTLGKAAEESGNGKRPPARFGGTT